MEKWKRIQEDFEADDVYLSSACSLYYDLDFDRYVKGQKASRYLSLFFIFNSSGSDKKELLVFGNETIETTSLPLKYHICKDSKVTLSAIHSFLLNWNEHLKSEERCIRILITLPTPLQGIHLSNIEIVDLSDFDFVYYQVEKIVKCFKYHYRKLQMIKNIVYSKNATVFALLDYMNIIIGAWNFVSNNYIHHLFYPYEEGSPNIDEEETRLSLADWCIKHNVPINMEFGCELVDDFISCDNQLKSTYFEGNGKCTEAMFDGVESTSGIDAYQAMKRLLSYLQGEGVQESTIKSAKALEDNLQLGALKEMQGIASHDSSQANNSGLVSSSFQ